MVERRENQILAILDTGFGGLCGACVFVWAGFVQGLVQKICAGILGDGMAWWTVQRGCA